VFGAFYAVLAKRSQHLDWLPRNGSGKMKGVPVAHLYIYTAELTMTTQKNKR